MTNTTTEVQPFEEEVAPRRAEKDSETRGGKLAGKRGCNNKVVLSGLKSEKNSVVAAVPCSSGCLPGHEVGIDTIAMWTSVVPGMVAASNGLKPFRDRKVPSKVYYGDQGRCEDEGIIITVSSPIFAGYSYGGGAPRCYIRFSMPKLATENVNNFAPLDYAGTCAMFAHVEEVARRNGINVEVRKMRLCRLDLFKNVVLDAPCSLYMPILRAMYLSRAKIRFFKSGSLLHNKRHSLTVYDKIVQMQDKGVDTAGFPQNVLRFEWRIKSARKVQDILKMVTVEDLLTNFSALTTHYDAFFQKDIFPFNGFSKTQHKRRRGVACARDYLHRMIELLQDRGINSVTFEQLNQCYKRRGVGGVRDFLKAQSQDHKFRVSLSDRIKTLRQLECEGVLVGAQEKRHRELVSKLFGS